MSAISRPSRQDFRRLALEWAGREWDSMQARDAERDARVQAMRDAEAERITARQQRDAREQRAREDAVSFVDPTGRDPRRTLALRIAVRAQQDADAAREHAKRMRSLPCPGCGHGAGHGHGVGCA